MAVACASVFLLKIFYLIYLFNFSIYVFIFYIANFFLVSLVFFILFIIIIVTIPIQQEENPFDRYILNVIQDVAS